MIFTSGADDFLHYRIDDLDMVAVKYPGCDGCLVHAGLPQDHQGLMICESEANDRYISF
jgi:hypothetical protein